MTRSESQGQRLAGKRAVVTGGGRGIGKAIALCLAREGVDVAICARRKDVLEDAAAEIARETNRKIVPIVADLTRTEDANAFIEGAAELVVAPGVARLDLDQSRKRPRRVLVPLHERVREAQIEPRRRMIGKSRGRPGRQGRRLGYAHSL